MLQQIGTPSEVYDRPANLFVAGFMGSPPMNFFAGEIAGGRFRCSDGGFASRRGSDPAQATLGFRPEDAEVVPVGAGLFDGRVYAAEMTGEQTLVTIEKGAR